MGRIVVCGGSVIGLSVAMMLGADGHEVTVLESDGDGAPGSPQEAWRSWQRRGVAQFRQPHNLFTRFRQICDQELPGLTERLSAAGCVWVNYLDSPPPTLSDTSARPGDAALRFITGRRPVIESVIANAAQDQSGVSVRRGARVAGLIPGPTVIRDVPHAVGVYTDRGEQIRADLVIDATGRRTPSRDWLAGLGAREALVESEDRGFVYYTRYFTGPTRPRRLAPTLSPMGSFSVVTLDGDNDTWSVTLFALSCDTPLKMLREPDVFTRVVRACPRHAHWLDGTPITDVLAMGGVLDRYHRFVADDQPLLTGFAAVGDAWACTNPTGGRGLSVGLIHAQLLRATIRDHLDDPAGFARQWDAQTERVVGPHYRHQRALDRARLAEMDATRNGHQPPAPEPTTARFLTAAAVDPDVFRAMIEIVVCLALPQEVLARPGITDAISRIDPDIELMAIPGPDRAQLLRLLAA